MEDDHDIVRGNARLFQVADDRPIERSLGGWRATMEAVTFTTRGSVDRTACYGGVAGR